MNAKKIEEKAERIIRMADQTRHYQAVGDQGGMSITQQLIKDDAMMILDEIRRERVSDWRDKPITDRQKIDLKRLGAQLNATIVKYPETRGEAYDMIMGMKREFEEIMKENKFEV